MTNAMTTQHAPKVKVTYMYANTSTEMEMEITYVIKRGPLFGKNKTAICKV